MVTMTTQNRLIGRVIINASSSVTTLSQPPESQTTSRRTWLTRDELGLEEHDVARLRATFASFPDIWDDPALDAYSDAPAR